MIFRRFHTVSSLFVWIYLVIAALVAQTAVGRVVEGQSVESKILGRPVRYSVYLPPDYDTSARAYPVVYLLHGFSGNETDWVQFGEIQQAVDRGIAERKLSPMIIVMPDGGNTWYINNFDGKVRYEDFFFQEFMPSVESRFRIRADKHFRAMAGLSMGGYGSLYYCMKHHDMFTACAALSAGIEDEQMMIGKDQGGWDNLFGIPYGAGRIGKDRITQCVKDTSVLNMAQSLDKNALASVRYYLDFGDKDYLGKGNAELHIIFLERGIAHEARMRDGGHNWTYWRSGIANGLAFISADFRQN
jgi:enterochelin esterase-like enzyme